MGTVHLQDLLGKSGVPGTGEHVPAGPLHTVAAIGEKKLVGHAIFKVNLGPAIE